MPTGHFQHKLLDKHWNLVYIFRHISVHKHFIATQSVFLLPVSACQHSIPSGIIILIWLFGISSNSFMHFLRFWSMTNIFVISRTYKSTNVLIYNMFACRKLCARMWLHCIGLGWGIANGLTIWNWRSANIPYFLYLNSRILNLFLNVI